MIAYAPGMLTPGTSSAHEESFLAALISRLGSEKRVVLATAGDYSLARRLALAGVGPERMLCLGANLFTVALGYHLSGKPISNLEIEVDGEKLDGDVYDVLFAQLFIRAEDRASHSSYWKGHLEDLIHHRKRHMRAISEWVARQDDLLSGISFETLRWGLVLDWENPDTVLVIRDEVGKRSFWETPRITWDAPDHVPWTDDHCRALAEFAGPALLLVEQTCTARTLSSKALPVFARGPRDGGENTYIWTNRIEEVFAVTGGPKVMPKRGSDPHPLPCPVLPRGLLPQTPESVTVTAVTQPEALWYMERWGVREPTVGNAFALIVDGHVAGVAGYAFRSTEPNEATILYLACNPEMTRLLVRVACLRSTLDEVVRRKPGLALAAAGVDSVTHTVFSRKRSHRDLKDAMILDEETCLARKPPMYRLTYRSELWGYTAGEVYEMEVKR